MTLPRAFCMAAAVCTALIFPTCLHAQDTELVEQVRERIVVDVEQIEVKSVASALEQLSGNADLRIFADAATNRLVLDAPKDAIPAALGLIRELDRPVPRVEIKFTEVELPLEKHKALETGPTKVVKNELAKLEKAGDGTVLHRLSLAAMGNTTAEIQIGARTPFVTGGNKGASMYDYQETGIVLQCTPRVARDAVLLDFLFDKSYLAKPPADDREFVPPSVVNSRSQSIVRIPQDDSVVIGGQRLNAAHELVAWKIIISANVLDEE